MIVDIVFLFTFCMFNRKVGAKTVYLVIIDGGADWVAAEDMVRSKFPWIYFLPLIPYNPACTCP